MVIGVGAAVVGLNVLGASALYAAGAFPDQFDDGRGANTESAPPEVGATRTPAADAVAATIATEVPGLGGTAPTALGAGATQPYPCQLQSPVPAAVGAYRRYTAGDVTVPVSVSVYPAGTGMWVMATLTDQLQNCGADRGEVRAVQPVPGLGVNAVSAQTPAGEAVVVRRGDVVVRATGPAPQADAVARALDTTLGTNLASCANQAGAPGDERRNPWLANVPYQGLLSDQGVSIPALGPPEPPLGVLPVALDAPDVALTPVELPDKPADPVWPAALPSQVSLPTAPARPGSEPTATVIKVPEVDTVGPGCGWRFAASTAPAVDPQTIAQRRDALVAAARSSLTSQQKEWLPRVTGYYRAWADYERSVSAYRVYSAQVQSVAAAWDVISSQRSDYQRQLSTYNSAVRRRDEFISQQTTARAEYEAAVAACAVPLPTPIAPSPTASTPGPIQTPAPLPTVRPGCPPQRPSILDELPPTVPVKPTPPPDPRPVEARG